MPFSVRKELVAAQEVIEFYPDPEYVGFTAKAQRSKTRKGKDYYVIRITIPKYAAEQIKAGPEEHLVLKAKKALWYHMLDWNEMKPAWTMLPSDIKADVIMAGLPNPDGRMIVSLTGLQNVFTSVGATVSGNQMNPEVAFPVITKPGQGVQ